MSASTTHAVLLHDLDDAAHCIASGAHAGAVLLSTHTSVDVWLAEEHGLQCRCVTRPLSNDDLLGLRARAGEIVDRVLAGLEAGAGPALGELFGERFDFIAGTYAYLGKFHVDGYLAFAEGMRRTALELGISHVTSYERSLSEALAVSTGMREVLSLVPDLEVEIVRRPDGLAGLPDAAVPKRSLARMSAGRVARKALGKLRHRAKVGTFRRFSPGRATVLLAEPLGQLESVYRQIGDVNIAYLPLGAWHPLGMGRPLMPVDAPDALHAAETHFADDPVASLFAHEVVEDLSVNLGSMVSCVDAMRELAARYGLAAGIWGGPPVTRPAALAFAFLTARGLPVLGVQHGSAYGDSIEPWHFDSDFDRCDAYISYGFTAEDLAHAYPDRTPRARIEPLGAPRHAETIGERPVDIVFPVTNALAVFNGGASRTSPDELAHRQVTVLRHLDDLDGVSVVAKPFLYHGPEYNAVLPVLKRLRRVKVIDDVTFTEFLSAYRPRLVVIEFNSQPTFDALHTDAEIIVIGDPVHPMEPRAQALLERRVYYTMDLQVALGWIDDFAAGRLEPRCDQEFYRHYVHQLDANARVSGFVREFVSGAALKARTAPRKESA